MELKKISNLAGIMDRILKIVQIINYILMGITLLSSIATMASAGHLFQSSYTVNLGNYILKMKNSGNYDASQIRNIVVLKFLSMDFLCHLCIWNPCPALYFTANERRSAIPERNFFKIEKTCSGFAGRWRCSSDSCFGL